MAGYIYGIGQPQHNGRANVLPSPYYYGYGFYYNPGVQNIEGVTRQFGIFNGVGVGGSSYTPAVSRPTYYYSSYGNDNGHDFGEVSHSSNRSHQPMDLYSRVGDPSMGPHTRVPNPWLGIQGSRSSSSPFLANNNHHNSSSSTRVQVGPNPYNKNGGIQIIQGDALLRGNFYGRGTGARTHGHLRISGDIS